MLTAMSEETRLRPATPDEIQDALAFALRFQGRKRVHHADNMMAQITAERLVEHLERSGFVVMKKPPAPMPRVLLRFRGFDCAERVIT